MIVPLFNRNKDISYGESPGCSRKINVNFGENLRDVQEKSTLALEKSLENLRDVQEKSMLTSGELKEIFDRNPQHLQ